MTTYTLRSNLDRGTPVLIPDLGFFVPASGGSVTFSDDGNIQEVQESLLTGSLATLTNDGLFVGGTDPSEATIILNINGADIAPGEGDRAVNAVPLAVQEQDGTPAITGVTTIKFANGTVTDDGAGVVSVANAGGGGNGTINEVNDGATTVSSPAKIKIAETGTVTEPVVGTAQIAIRPAVDYAGQFEGISIGTGDITLNKWGWWYDTVNSRLMLVRNRAGVLYGVQANPL